MHRPGWHFFSKGAGIPLNRPRTGVFTVIAGYCNGSAVSDEAPAEWAETCGVQTVKDRKTLLKVIDSGRVIAQ